MTEPGPQLPVAYCRVHQHSRASLSLRPAAFPQHPPSQPSLVARALVSQRLGDVRHSGVHIRRRLKLRCRDIVAEGTGGEMGFLSRAPLTVRVGTVGLRRASRRGAGGWVRLRRGRPLPTSSFCSQPPLRAASCWERSSPRSLDLFRPSGDCLPFRGARSPLRVPAAGTERRGPSRPGRGPNRFRPPEEKWREAAGAASRPRPV